MNSVFKIANLSQFSRLLNRDQSQIADVPAMALNSDEDMQIHDDNKEFLSAKRSQTAQKKHRKAYIYSDDDDSTDDIINTSSADDNMSNLLSNRNMGVYRIIVCTTENI